MWNSLRQRGGKKNQIIPLLKCMLFSYSCMRNLKTDQAMEDRGSQRTRELRLRWFINLQGICHPWTQTSTILLIHTTVWKSNWLVVLWVFALPSIAPSPSPLKHTSQELPNEDDKCYHMTPHIQKVFSSLLLITIQRWFCRAQRLLLQPIK